MEPIIDLHSHPQMKPFNSNEERRMRKGLWLPFGQSDSCKNSGFFIKKAVESTKKTSQSNLDQAIAGNVKGLFVSLYPVERNFFDPRRSHFLLNLFLPDQRMRDFATCLTGFDREKVDKIFDRISRNEGINYYAEELIDEYNFLLAQTADGRFEIATDYDDFIQTFLQNGKIASILTIEGAHALGNYSHVEDFWRPVSDANKPAIHQRLMVDFASNINRIKSWGGGNHCPFFITFCHHFCNLLAGHSQSFGDGSFMPGMSDLLNQRNGIDEGFSKTGWEVLDLLLSKTNGRRILIDVKHMSAKARMEFFDYLEKNYWSRGEELPVICSHGAFSGYRTLEESNKPDSLRRYRRNYLSKQSINISDEEAQIIVRSKGLIGLVLHGGRLPGGKAKSQLKEAKNRDQQRDTAIALIMSNILHMVRAVDDLKAWDCITLGTDMDGIIEPLQPYTNYSSLGRLSMEILQFFHRPFDLTGIGMTKGEVKKYMYHYSPEELTKKIMSQNALDFLRNYFNEDYLIRRV